MGAAAILQMLPRRKGRQAIGMPDAFFLYPAYLRATDRSCVYVMAFKGGVVKVGRSGSPRSRMYDHYRRANGEVLWMHLFCPIRQRAAILTEQRVPAAIRDFARQINGSEWFYTVEDKLRIVEVVRSVMQKASEEYMASEARRAANQLRAAAAKKVLADAGITGMSVY
jgi:hypothetical protein